MSRPPERGSFPCYDTPESGPPTLSRGNKSLRIRQRVRRPPTLPVAVQPRPFTVNEPF